MSRTANKPAQKGSMPQKRLGRTLSDHEVYELQRREHEARQRKLAEQKISQQKMAEQKFCETCAKNVYCSLRFESDLRSQCPILKAYEEPVHYRNHEQYKDPTAFFALRNVMKPRRTMKHRQKSHPKTQVAHFDK